LDDVISPQQSAFILGRYIAENIMLAQELVKNYHRIGGTLRCAIKVDIMKANEDEVFNLIVPVFSFYLRRLLKIWSINLIDLRVLNILEKSMEERMSGRE